MVRVSDVNPWTKSAGTIPPYNAMSASHIYNKQWDLEMFLINRGNVPTHKSCIRMERFPRTCQPQKHNTTTACGVHTCSQPPPPSESYPESCITI